MCQSLPAKLEISTGVFLEIGCGSQWPIQLHLRESLVCGLITSVVAYCQVDFNGNRLISLICCRELGVPFNSTWSDLNNWLYTFQMKKILVAVALACLIALGSSQVVELNDSNFQSTVSADPLQLWMVFFHADWVLMQFSLVPALQGAPTWVREGKWTHA